jgi:hypothetical protein
LLKDKARNAATISSQRPEIALQFWVNILYQKVLYECNSPAINSLINIHLAVQQLSFKNNSYIPLNNSNQEFN